MNRRSLFGALAVLPLSVAAAKAALEAKPGAHKPEMPIGFIKDSHYLAPDCGPGTHTHSIYMMAIPPHSHTFATGYQGTAAIAKREIFDGEKFVPFDSPEGAAVFNSLIAKISA